MTNMMTVIVTRVELTKDCKEDIIMTDMIIMVEQAKAVGEMVIIIPNNK